MNRPFVTSDGRPSPWVWGHQPDDRPLHEKLEKARLELMTAGAERDKLASEPGTKDEILWGQVEDRFESAEADFASLMEDATNCPFDKLHAAVILCSQRRVVR